MSIDTSLPPWFKVFLGISLVIGSSVLGLFCWAVYRLVIHYT